MIILGQQHTISSDEKQLLRRKVHSLHMIDIVHTSDEDIIKEIQRHIEDKDAEFLVLNLEHDVSLKLKSYLETLDYDGLQIMMFAQFTSSFLGRCHIDFNPNDFHVMQDIHHNILKDITKRIFDFSFALLVLLLLSPVFAFIAFMIKFNSPEGHVFFGHRRIGKDGKFFRVYKFRTMVPHAEEILKQWLDNNPDLKAEYEKDFKLKNDPRIIKGIGNFLRKTSLDELPQFFNALIGNMSIVGPRPIVENEVEKYGQFAIKLYSVKPGVTGLWQVSGRNDIGYDERVKLDMDYIDNQSFMLDLKIILKTIKVMLFRDGAY